MSNAESTPIARNLRATFMGRVTSDKMTKTITVLVERTYKHPKYGKYMRKNKRYHAHDEGQIAATGDLVEIEATRPLSRMKRWRLVRVIEAAPDRGVDLTTLIVKPDDESESGADQ